MYQEVKDGAVPSRVAPELIERHGAVSAEVARALAEGARAKLGADVGVGVTGLAMVREAIEGYLESLLAHDDPVPRPIEIERVTVTA
jgi:Competence-damaged protein